MDHLLAIVFDLTFWLGLAVGVLAGPYIKSLVSKFIKK